MIAPAHFLKKFNMIFAILTLAQYVRIAPQCAKLRHVIVMGAKSALQPPWWNHKPAAAGAPSTHWFSDIETAVRHVHMECACL